MDERSVKASLNQRVRLPDGIEYKFVAAIINKNEDTGEYWYQAKLKDLKAHSSYRICKLEDVEAVD